jgi:hypothetical protein
MMAGCPRPDKVAYRSKAEAMAAFRRMHEKRRGQGAHVYRCRFGCGMWHVGRTFRRAVVAWRSEP